MTKIVQTLFGGGDAKEQAAIARQEQRVANDRQLAAANEQSQRAAVSRRAPRGRRLFEERSGGNLSSTLGG